MQLLLVDNRVKDVQTVTQSLLPSVDYVLVDFETDTYETLVAKIPVKTYDSVGIFQENYELNTYQLVRSFGNSVLTNVQIQDPTLHTWSQYKKLLSYFKDILQAKRLDLMGCNINSSPDWNYVIDYLGKQFQISINSSNDNTGSPDFGGNWILESGNVDLIGKYFSNNIDKYQFILGQASNSSYVITTDNKLYGCGANNYGTMDDADISSTVNFTQVPDVTNITALYVSSNSNFSFVIKSDGSLWITGYDGNGQFGNSKTFSLFTKVYDPTLNNNIKCTAVSCSQTYTQILLSDGSVKAVGANWYGQLGTGDTTSRSVFTTVYTPSSETTKCTAVSSGSYHTQILLLDGSVKATGVNWYGNLGTGDTTSRSVFTTVYTPSSETTKCIAVSCGDYNTQIVLSDGSVKATGYNGYGELGIENTTQPISFITVYIPSSESTKCRAVSCSSYNTQLLLLNGSVKAAGVNWYGQLGTGDTTNRSVFTTVYDPDTNFGIQCTAVSCGYYHTQILLSDGSVKAAGGNFSGQLGTGNFIEPNSFTTVYTPSSETTKCTAVSSGSSYTHILLSDGSVRATGNNVYNQLGLYNGVNVNLLRYLNINVTFISTGNDFIAVIKSDGSVWTKGTNYYGQLGTGDTTSRSVFTKVYTPSNGVKCTLVSCGQSNTLMLLSDGSVKAVGDNSYGQLGTGDTTSVTVFKTVYNHTLKNNIKCTAISSGYYHTLLLLSDGSVEAVGANWYGQLGTGDTTSLTVFTKVYTPSGGVTCKGITCGQYTSLILLSDGSVKAVGPNWYGQLGTGNTTSLSVFTTVYDPTVNNNIECTLITCGAYHSQILLADGSVKASGTNNWGQLGNNSITNVTVFTKVYNPDVNNNIKCTAIACGFYHTQILLSDGSVKATGYNGQGALGNGNYIQQQIFVTMLNSDGTNMSNVLLLPEMVPPPPPPPLPPTITNVVTLDGVTSVSFTQIPSDGSITNYGYSTSSVINSNNNFTVGPFSEYTLLSPAQTSSPLIIHGLNGVVQMKIKAFTTVYTNESNSFKNWYEYPLSMICFKEDTQILTSNGYVPIQDLKKGDLVETFKHGLKPITVIAKEEIFHTASATRMADQLYKSSNSEYSELFADLVITGRHSILVDELHSNSVNKKECDGKYKLQAYKNNKFTVYEPKGKYMIFNFALQCDDDNINYGVYANGLLVECCGEKCLREQKAMMLV